jgi:hypothetical protein
MTKIHYSTKQGFTAMESENFKGSIVEARKQALSAIESCKEGNDVYTFTITENGKHYEFSDDGRLLNL